MQKLQRPKLISRRSIDIKKEIIVHLLSSDPKKGEKNEGPRIFVLYQCDEIAIENIKETFKTLFPQTPSS